MLRTLLQGNDKIPELISGLKSIFVLKLFFVLFRLFTIRFQDIYRNLLTAVFVPHTFPATVWGKFPYIS